jgi:quercetin dioxygenase-like cupin family protein
MNPRRMLGAIALLVIPLASIYPLSISLGAAASTDAALPMQRLTPAEIAAKAAASAPSGTGVQMTSLIGDPTKPGLYTVRVAIAPHTQARPHTHRDNRSVTVISGTWHMGYGKEFDAKALKDLPPGSFFTEPAGQPHFAQAGDEAVVIWVTGYGPSDTQFITP